MLRFCVFVLFFTPSAFAFEKGCDLLGKNFKILKKIESPEVCEKSCQKTKACRGFVYVSGWKRCFLKSEVKRKTLVVMTSGEAQGHLVAERDFSGKDIRQVAASNPENCQNLCQKEKMCRGLTYIGGYSTCWLKSEGQLRKKVFYCGQKS